MNSFAEPASLALPLRFLALLLFFDDFEDMVYRMRVQTRSARFNFLQQNASVYYIVLGDLDHCGNHGTFRTNVALSGYGVPR